jgi:hypothetical protein
MIRPDIENAERFSLMEQALALVVNSGVHNDRYRRVFQPDVLSPQAVVGVVLAMEDLLLQVLEMPVSPRSDLCKKEFDDPTWGWRCGLPLGGVGCRAMQILHI